MSICLSHWLSWKNTTLTHKIKKWGCSDLILGVFSSIHLRCPQVWYGTLGPNGLKTICLFRWEPIDFHWKDLLLLWPYLVSTHIIIIFQTLVPFYKSRIWKLSMIPRDLENKVKVILMACNERYCHYTSWM